MRFSLTTYILMRHLKVIQDTEQFFVVGHGLTHGREPSVCPWPHAFALSTAPKPDHLTTSNAPHISTKPIYGSAPWEGDTAHPQLHWEPPGGRSQQALADEPMESQDRLWSSWGDPAVKSGLRSLYLKDLVFRRI